MPILTHPAFGPRTAIIYVTAGTLIDVWTGVWWWAYGRGEDLSRNTQFWLCGFFLTGLTLIVIGFLLGRIGRAARKVEMPPSEAVNAEATIQATAAANPAPVIAAGTPANAAVPAPRTVTTTAAPMNAPAAQQPAQYVPGVTRI